MRTLALANLLALGVVLAVNYFSNTGLIAGRTVGEVSAFYPNFFTPAGITFAIWGIIYLFLAGFVGYQVRDLFRAQPLEMPFRRKIGGWFLLSCLANSLWIVFWLNLQPGLAFLMMLVLLGSLLMIYLRLDLNDPTTSIQERILVLIPFSLYTGWITVATIANATAWLVDLGWNGDPLTRRVWGLLMIATAALLGTWVVLRRRDSIYGTVIVWALVGILLARVQASPVLPNLIIAAGLGIAIVIGSIVQVLRTNP